MSAWRWILPVGVNGNWRPRDWLTARATVGYDLVDRTDVQFFPTGQVANEELNRDGVKLTTVEANGLYRTLNEWDPILLLDGHLMSRVNHGYANTYGSVTGPDAPAAGHRLPHQLVVGRHVAWHRLLVPG